MSGDLPIMRIVMRCASVLAMLASVSAGVNAQSIADADMVEMGRRIYREGILPSGQPLQGVAAANVWLSGAQAACATCHRRSGYGSSEGPVEVRAITGPALFGERVAPTLPALPAWPTGTPRTSRQTDAEVAAAKATTLREVRAARFSGARQRRTYDDTALGHAIRGGVDVNGRAMNPSMPRFALDPVALASLGAYLKTLSVQASPGVTADTVHFATVIQPGIEPAQRQALIDVLQTYMQDRNLGLRVEARREAAGLVRLNRTYREWMLHVWDLKGDSDTWAGQLEAFNAAQPVFALVSGLGNASWRPIHAFSERYEVPCVLPQVAIPVLGEPDFYTVYLSRGMTLEAQALAKFLLNVPVPERGTVTQVYSDYEASTAGAQAFRAAWNAGEGGILGDQRVKGVPDEKFWLQLAQKHPAQTLVVWLKPHALESAQALIAPQSRVKTVYLSSYLNASPRTGIAANGEGRVRLVYSQDLPSAREGRLNVVKRWLASNGLKLTDETLQMNAYLAATVTGQLMSHSKDTYSREFFLERMEHLLGTSVETSIYPRLSLGPGQRYASKGSYIVAVAGAQDSEIHPVSDWIVP
jgi:cytochrome c553